MRAPTGPGSPERPAPAWPLVGRADELSVLRESIAAGAPAIVLAGPPGVGKSRVAHEAADEVAHAFVEVRANRSAAAIPLGALAPLLPTLGTRDARQQDLVARAAEHLVAHRADADRLVVLVDDAHDLDELSAEVLAGAADDAAVTLLLTLRDDARLPRPLERAAAEPRSRHLRIAALDRAATSHLIEHSLGGSVDGAAAQAVWERSQGNPLYLRELLLGAVDHGILVDDDGLWRLAEPLAATPRLTELVEARLRDLAEDERHAVELVAFGEPVAADLLGGLADPDALARVQTMGIVLGDEVLRLAHPLYGEVLRTTMPSLRALRVNRRLADAAEQRGTTQAGVPDGTDALRLAVWRLDGGGPGDPLLLTRGAEAAHVAHHDELAERLARAALDAGAGVGAGLVLAASFVERGRHEEADRLFTDLAERALAPGERVVLAKRWAETLAWGLARPADADAVLADAIGAVAHDDEARNELVARRAMFRQQTSVRGATDDELRPILDGPEGRAFCEAAITAGFDLAARGRTADAEALSRRAFEVQWGIEDQFGLLHPGAHLTSLTFALTEAGRLDEAEHVASVTGYDVAVAMHLSFGQAWMGLVLGRIALDRGRAAHARRRFQEAALVFGEIGQAGPRAWALAGLALASSSLGRIEEAEAALAEVDAAPATMPVYRIDGARARAWIRARRGERAQAREHLGAEAEQVEHAATALAVRAWHDVARLGGADAAVDPLTRLVGETDGAFGPARVLHVQGLAHDDPTALGAAADAFDQLGAHLLAAEAHRSRADAARRLGLRAVTAAADRRADELLEHCDGGSIPGLRVGAGVGLLTRREQEVAGLAAGGRSNQEIADHLALSVRTVENHLQRTYEKLGVGGRDALASAMAAG